MYDLLDDMELAGLSHVEFTLTKGKERGQEEEEAKKKKKKKRRRRKKKTKKNYSRSHSSSSSSSSSGSSSMLEATVAEAAMNVTLTVITTIQDDPVARLPVASNHINK